MLFGVIAVVILLVLGVLVFIGWIMSKILGVAFGCIFTLGMGKGCRSEEPPKEESSKEYFEVTPPSPPSSLPPPTECYNDKCSTRIE